MTSSLENLIRGVTEDRASLQSYAPSANITIDASV
jgi:hypothetical protein